MELQWPLVHTNRVFNSEMHLFSWLDSEGVVKDDFTEEKFILLTESFQMSPSWSLYDEIDNWPHWIMGHDL